MITSLDEYIKKYAEVYAYSNNCVNITSTICDSEFAIDSATVEALFKEAHMQNIIWDNLLHKSAKRYLLYASSPAFFAPNISPEEYPDLYVVAKRKGKKNKPQPTLIKVSELAMCSPLLKSRELFVPSHSEDVKKPVGKGNLFCQEIFFYMPFLQNFEDSCLDFKFSSVLNVDLHTLRIFAVFEILLKYCKHSQLPLWSLLPALRMIARNKQLNPELFNTFSQQDAELCHELLGSHDWSNFPIPLFAQILLRLYALNILGCSFTPKGIFLYKNKDLIFNN